MTKIGIVIVISIALLFNTYNEDLSEINNEVNGSWQVIRLIQDGQARIPDTINYANLSPIIIIKNGVFSIPTITYEDRSRPTGRYKIVEVDSTYKFKIYESVDSLLIGQYQIQIFEDTSQYESDKIATYMSLEDSTFYLLARKIFDE